MWPFSRTKLVIDPAMGDSTSRSLLDALARRDWVAACDIFKQVQAHDERTHLLSVCARVPGVQEWIGDWIAAEPESTLPLLVKGCHGVSWAWEARGARFAKDTREEQFREFARRLKIAEDALDEVVARDSEEAAAWSFLVESARGRRVGPVEAYRRFDNAVRCDPNNLVAHEAMLQFLCEKWFGSHEEMFDFARSAAAKAPAGSLLPEVIVVAHLERWLRMPPGEALAYMVRADVRAELRAAATQSIWHPAFQAKIGWQPRLNTFAMGFTLAEDWTAAAQVFDILGDQVTEWPWQYQIGRPEKRFAKARRKAYAKRA